MKLKKTDCCWYFTMNCAGRLKNMRAMYHSWGKWSHAWAGTWVAMISEGQNFSIEKEQKKRRRQGPIFPRPAAEDITRLTSEGSMKQSNFFPSFSRIFTSHSLTFFPHFTIFHPYFSGQTIEIPWAVRAVLREPRRCRKNAQRSLLPTSKVTF